MMKKPLLLIPFAVVMLCLPGVAIQNKADNYHPSNQQTSSAANKGVSTSDNLPQSASALPLLSVVGAGAVLGGLLSARRTRADR